MTATRKPTTAQAAYLDYAIESNGGQVDYIPGRNNRQFFRVVARMREAGWVALDSLNVTSAGNAAARRVEMTATRRTAA